VLDGDVQTRPCIASLPLMICGRKAPGSGCFESALNGSAAGECRRGGNVKVRDAAPTSRVMVVAIMVSMVRFPRRVCGESGAPGDRT